jgi:hypothetical protein
MTNLERFCSAMDYPWLVERYELDGQDRLTVHYRSQRHMDVTWSHQPFTFEMVPKVGTVGRIGFISNLHIETDEDLSR